MTSRTKIEPENVDDEVVEFEAAVREGIAQADSGRLIPYEKMRRWLLSWGSDKELLPPK